MITFDDVLAARQALADEMGEDGKTSGEYCADHGVDEEAFGLTIANTIRGMVEQQPENIEDTQTILAATIAETFILGMYLGERKGAMDASMPDFDLESDVPEAG